MVSQPVPGMYTAVVSVGRKAVTGSYVLASSISASVLGNVVFGGVMAVAAVVSAVVAMSTRRFEIDRKVEAKAAHRIDEAVKAALVEAITPLQQQVQLLTFERDQARWERDQARQDARHRHEGEV